MQKHFARQADGTHAQLEEMAEVSRNDGERRGVHFVAAVTYIDEGKVQQALAELGVEYELAQKMDDAPNAAGDQINMRNIHLEQGGCGDGVRALQKSAGARGGCRAAELSILLWSACWPS